MTGSTPPAKVALVTGGGRGLGRSIARGLCEAGVSVGLLGRNRESLDAVAAEIVGEGGSAAVAQADVRSFGDLSGAIQLIEAELGGIDLLVNNAGVIESAEVPIWEADPDDWWDVVETDLRGPFHCTRAVVPGMLARGGGRVVQLSSGAGAQDREIYSAYCAAKAGLLRISGNLHLAGYEHGLRAFDVSPGVVHSDMTHSMEMHRGRTDWTPPEALVELVVAVAAGELDAWSGCFLKAGVDTPGSLAEAAAAIGDPVPAPRRRLGIRPYGHSDPLT